MSADVIVSQLGARMHYALPRILASAGRLSRFYTDICATDGWTSQIGKLPFGNAIPAITRLAGRIPEGVPKDRIVTFPWFGLRSALIRLRNHDDAAVTRHALWAGRRFSMLVARRGYAGASGLYTFAGDGLEQIEAAKHKGLWVAVEQMNAPREVLDVLVNREQARFPDWVAGIPESSRFAEAFAQRERAEWALADLIVCPSDFVLESVRTCGGPVEKCVVVPYGVDPGDAPPERGPRTGPLRVLTAGAIGLRKGSPYVLEAAEKMRGTASFRLVGPRAIPNAQLRRLDSVAEAPGVLPRSAMRAQYEWADVFLLPSVCEGSATVVYEALAAGLPAVVTSSTGSVVRNGEEGFVTPPGDTATIIEKLNLLASDSDLVKAMSIRARRRALEFSVERYGDRLLAALPPPRRKTSSPRGPANPVR
ncbi:glycosyltransferase family 4 protein [Sulfitobacter sabulilitoris]|uniref:Glycosyltransferase family 4 protein n=1 Tax=Sulfitobacter sabulilitoris TaxID=2562655 RepID=A0A5S3P882_9RHOB|nr:glycosyltransferase family 4 protein [Sulfitobacter sabulilitoris]TMM49594.1 glycosyltransferase family 4 protein [Sulfitobacter sabulilitoris]